MKLNKTIIKQVFIIKQIKRFYLKSNVGLTIRYFAPIVIVKGWKRDNIPIRNVFCDIP